MKTLFSAFWLSIYSIGCLWLLGKTSVSASCVDIPSGLIGWWPGDSSTFDFAGTNNGTLKNNASYVTGKVGNCFAFDGSAYIETSNGVDLNLVPGGSATFEMWAYRTNASVPQHIVGKRVGCGGGSFYQLAIGTGALPSATVPLNQWIHLAVVLTNNLAFYYTNGVLAHSGSGTIGSNTAPFRIGNASDTCQGFKGLLDEVAVYNRALLPDEISEIYNADVFGKCKPPFIAQTTPPSGASGVLSNSHVQVQFSEAMDLSSITTNSFFLRDIFNNLVAGTVSYDEVNLTAVFTPSFPLFASNIYLATVSHTVKDIAGNEMRQDASWWFSTDIGFTKFSTNVVVDAGVNNYEDQSIIVDGCTLTINGRHVFRNLLVANSGIVTHPAAPTGDTNRQISLSVTQHFVVDSSSKVDLDGAGYGPSSGPGKGLSGSCTGGGASHGGNGGAGSLNGGLGGVAYGSVTNPIGFGSGGGGGINGPGGAGGGAIVLDVGGVFRLNGTLSANGKPGSGPCNCAAGGGSGGSINLFASKIEGSGILAANGGNAGCANTGGGGGGRIALYYQTNSFAGIVSAYGGTGTQAGGAGTIYSQVISLPTGDLRLDNRGDTNGTTPLMTVASANLVIASNTTVYAIEPLTLAGLRIKIGAQLTQLKGQTGLVVTVLGDVTIENGGKLTADGKGHPTNTGPGAGLSGSCTGGGGAYGGAGGAGVLNGGSGGHSYGSIEFPVDIGSGGGGGINGPGGAGGGAIFLDISGSLTIDGSLTARGAIGAGPCNCAGGGGAGGSINVKALRLKGSGLINVDGGQPGCSNTGGGGGGRIAIYCGDNLFSGSVTAYGGGSTSPGGPGTVVIKSRTDDWNLTLGRQSFGFLESSQSIDVWKLPAVADQQVRLENIHSSIPGITFDLIGPDDWIGFSNVTVLSDYVSFPAPGIYRLLARNTNSVSAVSNAYSFRLEQTAQTTLIPGEVFNGSFTASGQAQLFRIQVPQGKQLRVSLNSSVAANRVELYARLGVPASRNQYGYTSRNATSSNQQLLIPDPLGGDWYVFIYGNYIDTPDTYTLEVFASDVLVSSVIPQRHGNSVPIELTLEGAGFNAHSHVSLLSSNGVLYNAAFEEPLSSTRMNVRFLASTVPAGIYSIRATKEGSGLDTLTNALEVLDGGQPKLETRLIIPGWVGRHVSTTIYAECSNTGTAAMPAPLLVVRGSDRAFLSLDHSSVVAGFWTYAQPKGYSDTVQFLAHGATPGVLQPGETIRVPIYYAGLQQPWDFTDKQVEFDLGVLTTDNMESVDWLSLKTSLKPSTIAAEAWEAIWPNFLDKVGHTWGDYVQLMDDNAIYLHKLGRDVRDINSLITFSFAQADGLHIIRTISSATDAYVPTPGLSLSFERYYPQSISSRYRLGSFGRGWTHNWEINLSIENDGPNGTAGTVIITGPGHSRRVFQPDGRKTGAYFSEAVDHGSLISSNGTFILIEPNGLRRNFNSNGTVDQIEDLNQHRITTTYTGNLLTKLTHSSGQSLTLAYDGGILRTIVDSFNRTSTFNYVDPEHLQSVTYHNNSTIEYGYSIGQGMAREHAITQITKDGDVSDFFTYDSKGMLSARHRNDELETLTFNFGDGGLINVYDAYTNRTAFYLDHRGLLARLEDPFTNIFQLHHDEGLNITSLIDPIGHSYQFKYDVRGNITQTTDPSGNTTRLHYGNFNKLLSVTDPKGQITSYIRNTNYNTVATIYPDQSAERWAYDQPNATIIRTNRRGDSIIFQSTTNGQIKAKLYSDGTRADYSYDNYGNLTLASNHLGVITLAYTNELLQRITYPGNLWIEFTYNDARRRATVFDQTGYQLGYEYNVAGRLQKITNSAGVTIVIYDYDLAGRLQKKTITDGAYTTYAYDEASRPVGVTNRLSDGALLSFFYKKFDSCGRNIETMTDNGIWSYSYDALNQITNATFASTTTNFENQSFAYLCDAAGNRLASYQNGTTNYYGVNNLNQYLQIGSTNYAFDLDGNLKTIWSTNAGVAVTNVVCIYDAENQMIEMRNGVDTWNYGYDALGRRLTTEKNGVKIQHVIDPEGLGNIFSEYTELGELLLHYQYGWGVLSRSDAAGESISYIFDDRGNTQYLLSGGESIINKYNYDPFGSLIVKEESVANAFEFGGELGVTKEEDGLNFMRARFYNSSLGRFNQTDPLGIASGDFNLYRFVSNDPVGSSDPTGFNKAEEHDSLSTTGGKVLHVLNAVVPGSEVRSILEMSPDLAKTYIAMQQRRYESYEALGYDLYPHMPGKPSPVWRAQHKPTPQQAPTPELNVSDSQKSETVASVDPNAFTAPAGFGTQNFIIGGKPLSYRIDFENDTNASAPAQIVTVSTLLTNILDWSSLELTEIAFGNYFVSIPPGNQRFETNLPVTFDGVDFEVQIEVGVRLPTGELYTLFRSIVPATFLPPPVNIGFLPPEDGTGRGQGHIGFTIRPRIDLTTGTEIRSVALICFDQQETIATDQIDPHNAAAGIDTNKQALVTIDAGTPVSQVQLATNFSASTNFVVALTGFDDVNGSGIESYDVFVSTNGGAFGIWQANVTNASVVFTGEPGGHYAFHSRARDHVGNLEPVHESADASLTVVDPYIATHPLSQSISNSGPLHLSVGATGTDLKYQWLKNGSIISKATNVTYSKVKTTTGDAGAYSVIVSNAFSVVTSAVATIKIDLPLVISKHPVSVNKTVGQIHTFTVNVNGNNFNYQWHFEGADIAGATGRTYTVNPVTLSKAGTYSVTVFNDNYSVNTTNANLAALPDEAPPKVSVVFPRPGVGYTDLVVSNYQLSINGKASDNARVEQVFFSNNGADFQSATLNSNGAAVTWTGNITVAPGTNVLRTYSVDFSGLYSLTGKLTFFYDIWSPFALITNPMPANPEISCAVKPTATRLGTPDGSMPLLVGRSYKLTVPDVVTTGYTLTNWTFISLTNGNEMQLETNRLALNFVMRSNLTVIANFITNPFRIFQGNYVGLFREADEVRHQSGGYFTLKVNEKRAYSGKLLLDGDSVSFSGKFNLDGKATNNLSRVNKGKDTLQLALVMDFLGASQTITGWVADVNAGWTSAITSDRHLWSKTNNPATAYATNYTMAIPGFDDSTNGPVGYGFVLVSVDADGKVKVAGSILADGEAISQTTTLSQDGKWPFHVPLYTDVRDLVLGKPFKRTRGELMGWLNFEANTNAFAENENLAPLGKLDWIKTSWTNASWTHGFTNQVVVMSSVQKAPAAGEVLYQPFTNFLAVLSEGALSSSITNLVTLVTNKNIFFVNTKRTNVEPVYTNRFTAALNVKNGFINGTFTNETSQSKSITWKGVLLQDYTNGYGIFNNRITTNASGKIEIRPIQ